MENNLYIDLSNLLLKHFSYLTEISMFYRYLYIALLGIAIVSLLVSLISYVEEENNKAIYLVLSWMIVVAGCTWYLVNDKNEKEQQIQVKLIEFNVDLEKLANQYKSDKDKVVNIAQDFLLCKKTDLLFKHQPQFYFKCTNKEYLDDQIHYFMVQENIKLLQTKITSTK